MTKQDKTQLLEYLNQFNAVVNDATQEVTRRVLNAQFGEQASPFAQPTGGATNFSGGVKLDAKVFLQQQLNFMEKQQQLWQNATRAMLGEVVEPLISEAPGDNRFSDGDWQGSPAFSYVKQAYLLNAEFMQEMVSALEFEDPKVGEQVRFYTRQLISSMAPTNYVLTNPEVCREILQTQGECLARGIDKFVRDLENSPSEAFKITQVDIGAFTLGEDLACTPGKVVFRNRLIELLQYAPQTDDVQAVPLLIVPPFINKYYILDLNQKKSLVRWLVSQGFTVFMISWVNPGEAESDFEFERYLFDGIVAALNVVKNITGSEQVNTAGYCVGGTALGMVQAYLSARGDNSIASMSLLTTMFDFSEPGEVGNYLNAQTLPLIEQSIKSKGYLDGRILALSFSLLRENNLFWSYFIENYLKGKDPIPFDILYWNSDSTNLPGPAYLYYLEQMYVGNRLCEDGALSVAEVPVVLSSIKVPCYCLAAQADHIVLWQSAYRSAALLGGNIRFVLTESGHVAGVVNPPDRGKYGHWRGSTDLQQPPEQWLADATLEPGSWWSDWRDWLLQHAGERVSPPTLGSSDFPTLDNAPGRYVRVRLEAQMAPPRSDTRASAAHA